jgi:hypothetical protein
MAPLVRPGCLLATAFQVAAFLAALFLAALFLAAGRCPSRPLCA